MKIIFLDFDGVMDTDSHLDYLNEQGLPGGDKFGLAFDPKCVSNLKEIIDATGADIVISSTWREDMTYEEILEMWKFRNLPGFVTDVTPVLRFRNRGDEIDAWLTECSNKNVRYVIIDDMHWNLFNRHQLRYFLRTSPYIGIDDWVVQEAIRLLNE